MCKGECVVRNNHGVHSYLHSQVVQLVGASIMSRSNQDKCIAIYSSCVRTTEMEKFGSHNFKKALITTYALPDMWGNRRNKAYVGGTCAKPFYDVYG